MYIKRLSTLVVLSVIYLCVVQAQDNGGNLVSAATPEATKAGALILSSGGNAVDAAVAVAFTLGVTEPAMSGMGGRTMLILSIPDKTPIAIGGHSLTPSVLDIEIQKSDLTYYKQASIPSQVKILHYTWQKYGSGKISWKALLQPAISYAKNGFALGVHRHHVFKRVEEKIKASPYHNRELLIDDEIPFTGDTIRQPTLANTLERLATHGADDFYHGIIAKQIAADFESNDGWISADDLANFPDPIETDPLQTSYRGYDVYSFVPPGGGWQVLQVLNLLEQFNPDQLDEFGQIRTLQLINAINISHNDRLANAISNYSNYEEEIAQKISKTYAKKLLEHTEKDAVENEVDEKGQGETTHFSIVDESGIAVSATSSIGAYFGSYTSTKDLGFFYNSYIKSLMGFGLGKSLEPNTNIPSSMSPTIVRKDGKNVLVIGTPGSKRIVSTIAQLIQLWVDGNQNIDELISLPRVHAISNKVYMEDQSIANSLLNEVRQEGFKIMSPSFDLTQSGLNAYFGGVHAIGFKGGQWRVAADPRRDGTTSHQLD